MQNQQEEQGLTYEGEIDYDSLVLGNELYEVADPFKSPEFTVEDETGVYIRIRDGEIIVEKPVKFEQIVRPDAELYVELYLTLVITTILLVVIRCHSLLKQQQHGRK